MPESLGLLNPQKENQDPMNNMPVKQVITQEEKENMDDKFFLSLLKNVEPKSTELPLEEQNKQREKYLNAGFTNDEIDEEFGIAKEKNPTIEALRYVDNTIEKSLNFLESTAPQVAASFVTGSTSWLVGKVAGTLVGLSAGVTEGDFDKGVEEGKKVEDWINEKFTYAPTDEKARETIEVMGHLLDHVNKFSKGVGETIEYGINDAAEKDTSGMMKALRLPQLAPWIRYVAEFGTELAIFKGLHLSGKEIASGIGKLESKFGERMPKNIKEVIKEIPKEDIGKIRELLEKETPSEEIQKLGGIDKYFESWLAERTPKEVDAYMEKYFDSWKPQEKVLTPKEKADIVYENILRDIPPQQAISKDVVKKYYEQNPDANPEDFFSHSVRREIERITREDQAANEAVDKGSKEYITAPYEIVDEATKLKKFPMEQVTNALVKLTAGQELTPKEKSLLKRYRKAIVEFNPDELKAIKDAGEKAVQELIKSVDGDGKIISSYSDTIREKAEKLKEQEIRQKKSPGVEIQQKESAFGEAFRRGTGQDINDVIKRLEKGEKITPTITEEQAPQIIEDIKKSIPTEEPKSVELYKLKDLPPEIQEKAKQNMEKQTQATSEMAKPAMSDKTSQQPEPKQGVESVLPQKVKIGKSPQTYTVIEELKSTPEETALGEKYYNIRNDKTGEVVTVESKDMKPVRKRIISDETLEKNVGDMKEKMSGLHSGVDPTILKHLAVIGAYYLETGVRDFAEFSAKVIEAIGTKYAERIKPYLQEAWDKAHETLKKNMIQQTGERLKTDSEKVEQKRKKSLFQTAQESDRVSPEVKAKIAELEQEYKVKPNPESIADANKKIGELGESEALKHIMDDTTKFNDVKMGMFDVLFEKLQERGEYDRAVDLWNAVDQQARDAGRGIQMLARWNAFKPEGFLKWVIKELDKVNNKRNILDDIFGGKKVELTREEKAYIIKRKYEINAMPDGVAKTEATLALIDYIAKKMPPTVSELIDLYRYQNMLSGWQTQTRNIYGGLFNVAVTRPLDIAARGTIDYFESVLFGKERQAYISDVPEYYKKAYNALPNAVDAFLNAWNFKTDMTKPDLGFDAQGALKLSRAKNAPKYLTVIQRFMEATDRFNLALIKQGDYAIQLKRGLTPEKALAEAEANTQLYLYRNKNNLKDPSLSVMSKVLADIQFLIARGEDLPVAAKPIKWAIPFLTTPINFGIQMIEHSPAGLIRTNGFTQEVRAKILAGSVITAVGTYMAMQDKVTWTAPTGEKEKQVFYAAGKKPFSVHVGGVQVPAWYFGPYALALMLPAAVKHIYTEQNDSLTASQIEKLSDIVMGVARFIGSQSSAQSIGNFFNFISGDVDYSFPSQLAFTSEQILPLSGLLRNVSKIVDPVYRDPEGFWESIQKDLPLLSDDIPAYKTPEGEDSKRYWGNGLMPYEVGIEDAYYRDIYDRIQKEAQIKNIYNEFQHKQERSGMVSDKEINEFFKKLGESYLE